MTLMMNAQVTLCQHPIAAHHLAILRNRNTPSDRFRSSIQELGRILMHEATRDLPLISQEIQTPLCPTQAQSLDPSSPLVVVPILRAGLAFSDVAMQLLPSAKLYHLGLYRDEESLRPVTYYNKLPENWPNGNARFFLLDPMLATGGSAIAAMDLLANMGVTPQQVRFVCLLAAPEGVKNLQTKYPKLQIYTAAVDEKLNEHGYIVPGLGDAGDRTFGTLGD